jgi:hypothetical protein
LCLDRRVRVRGNGRAQIAGSDLLHSPVADFATIAVPRVSAGKVADMLSSPALFSFLECLKLAAGRKTKSFQHDLSRKTIKGADMSSICVLRIPNVKPRLQEQSHGPGSEPISLLTFLHAENLRLQNMVAQLKRDTTALRQALENT